MKDKIFLIVRVMVDTSHPHMSEAIKELETAATTEVSIASTPNVKVLECEILKSHSNNHKKR
jgi:hypothetical protein